MNILRATLITLLVTAASFFALLIPLTMPVTVAPPHRATGATISLVDSLPLAKANIPSIPEKPRSVIGKTERAETSGSTPSPALPTADKGVAMTNEGVEPEVEIDSESLTAPIQDTATEQEPLDAEDISLSDFSSSEASLASVAVSAVSPDPQPSLVNGYYETASVDQGPSFDRTTLASRIKYPSLAKRQGIEGLVVLRLFISSSGKVERIEVEEDPGYGLAEAAVRAFAGLQGEPAVLGGMDVPVTLRYPVRFTLK